MKKRMTLIVAITMFVLCTVTIAGGIVYHHRSTNASATISEEKKNHFTIDLSDAAISSKMAAEMEKNPIIAVVTADYLSRVKLSDGTTVAELNPWIEEFQMKFADGKWAEEIDSEYEKYIEGLEVLLYRFDLVG